MLGELEMARLPRIYFEEAEDYIKEIEADSMERHKQKPFTRVCHMLRLPLV